MNPSQSSIYRDLELLMQWYLPIGNKMPKEQALQNLGNSFQQSLLDAMTSCIIALDTSDKNARLELINLIVYYLAKCRSVCGILYEYKDPHKEGSPVISHTQFANYLERVASLKRQLSGWKKKTASQP